MLFLFPERQGHWEQVTNTSGLLRRSKCPQVALVVKNPPANAGDSRDAGSIPGSGRSPHKIPFGQSSLVFLPEESHRQRSLAGYSPQGHAVGHAWSALVGEGNGTPLQHSFLPGESQGQGSLVGCRLWGRTESDTTEATWQQQKCFTTHVLPVFYESAHPQDTHSSRFSAFCWGRGRWRKVSEFLFPTIKR